jgi:hypothetical protein
MKKNLSSVILIAALIGAVTYGYRQKTRADFCERIALQNEGTIADLRGALERLKTIATQNLNEAVLQSHRADQALENCRKKK